MASASNARSPKQRKTGKRHKTPKLSDVMCPICLCILVEPVTLPCKHELCKVCFEESVRKATLSCPVCRTRISSWTRKATKDDTLVNVQRWNEIKKVFPEQVQNRINGLDSEIEEEEYPTINLPKVSSPGSIRREYELQLQEHETCLKKEREEEAKASEKLIEYLKREEAIETRIKVQSVHKDEMIAKKLHENLNKGNLRDETLEVNNFLSMGTGEMSGLSQFDETWHTNGSMDSQDSITREVNSHFKPIRAAPKTPPKKQACGTIDYPPMVYATPFSALSICNKENSPCSNVKAKLFTSTPLMKNSAGLNIFTLVKSDKDKQNMKSFKVVNQIKSSKGNDDQNMNGKRRKTCSQEQMQTDYELAKQLQEKFDAEQKERESYRRSYSLRKRNVKNYNQINMA